MEPKTTIRGECEWQIQLFTLMLLRKHHFITLKKILKRANISCVSKVPVVLQRCVIVRVNAGSGLVVGKLLFVFVFLQYTLLSINTSINSMTPDHQCRLILSILFEGDIEVKNIPNGFKTTAFSCPIVADTLSFLR